MTLLAIVLAIIAIVLASISLVATGTMALRWRLVRPRPHLFTAEEPEQISVQTLGRPIYEILQPMVEFSVPTDDGDLRLRDRFLLDDGLVLFASTNCGSCRHLVHDSAELLMENQVRSVVVAPTRERGAEFVEEDCRADGIEYMVDDGQFTRALGVNEFPLALTITDGVIADAHVVTTPGHLSKLLNQQSTTDEETSVTANAKED